MINDPVLLKLAEDKFWLSIADSDVLLLAKGIAFGRRLDATVEEPDVFPLAVQGPKAETLMTGLFGDGIAALLFRLRHLRLLGTRQVIARSGYSKQGGFEIYLEGGHLGGALWDLVWKQGAGWRSAPVPEPDRTDRRRADVIRQRVHPGEQPA
ncbi:MAG: hypothetical protein CM15mP115_01960 [Alphaproteobacteria bacterium]|nr:MAG: hypothetical protein CM15mP115_01960 [Alphaproteobacteria bacterium]